ncbi:hypothetical protein DL765_010858 [Monosporascus sp. GIB2]|nr:hypothetical protein DL765_010858 [Monosporascus sp. GIB2]
MCPSSSHKAVSSRQHGTAPDGAGDLPISDGASPLRRHSDNVRAPGVAVWRSRHAAGSGKRPGYFDVDSSTADAVHMAKRQ